MTKLDIIKELEFIRGMVCSLSVLLEESDQSFIVDLIESTLSHLTDHLTKNMD